MFSSVFRRCCELTWELRPVWNLWIYIYIYIYIYFFLYIGILSIWSYSRLSSKDLNMNFLTEENIIFHDSKYHFYHKTGNREETVHTWNLIDSISRQYFGTTIYFILWMFFVRTCLLFHEHEDYKMYTIDYEMKSKMMMHPGNKNLRKTFLGFKCKILRRYNGSESSYLFWWSTGTPRESLSSALTDVFIYRGWHDWTNKFKKLSEDHHGPFFFPWIISRMQTYMRIQIIIEALIHK